MSVKIVRSEDEVPFNPNLPLEVQANGAKQIEISYNPEDLTIHEFMAQFERVAKSGIGLNLNIKFNSNHTLEGYRAERVLEKISKDIEINEVAKMMVEMHKTAEKHLNEISEICERAINER